METATSTKNASENRIDKTHRKMASTKRGFTIRTIGWIGRGKTTNRRFALAFLAHVFAILKHVRFHV